MNQQNIKPTERYPKILWYQIKKPIPSEEYQRIIYNTHLKRITETLTKKYPTASSSDIKEAAIEQAGDMAYKELYKPYRLDKVVVHNVAEFNKMTAMIENSENFIQWYLK